MAVTLGIAAKVPTGLKAGRLGLGQQELCPAIRDLSSGRAWVRARAAGSRRSLVAATADFSNKQANRRVRTRAHSGMPTSIASVPVQVVRELLEAGHRYLDVRTPEEYSTGYVPGAVNIPYMFKHNRGLIKNNKFVDDVLQQFSKDDELVVGCLSGKRSLMAATELQAAQFTNVTECGGGFDAWIQSGLHYQKESVRATAHVD